MTAASDVREGEFTRAARGPGVVSRVRSSKWFLVILGLLLVVGIIGYLGRPDRDYEPYSIRNYDPSGARAVATVARDHGLALRQIDELRSAGITDPDATTLVIVSASNPQPYQARSIVDYPGRIVIFGASDELTDEISTSMYVVGGGATGAIDASCPDQAASRAATISTLGWRVTNVPDDAATCFEDEAGAVMVTVERPGKGDVTIIADHTIVTNDRVDEVGNASLVLQAIGKQERAVWYVGSVFDSSTLSWSSPSGGSGGAPVDSVTARPDFLPPGTGSALYALGVAIAALALWKGRRFGALVTEPLPVVIKASEATLGRARLYRAARATGRSAAALRAVAATRMAKRIGVSRAATAEQLVAAVAAASGRQARDVHHILYGPLPTTEAEMLDLIDAIDTLESEVHRP